MDIKKALLVKSLRELLTITACLNFFNLITLFYVGIVQQLKLIKTKQPTFLINTNDLSGIAIAKRMKFQNTVWKHIIALTGIRRDFLIWKGS